MNYSLFPRIIIILRESAKETGGERRKIGCEKRRRIARAAWWSPRNGERRLYRSALGACCSFAHRPTGCVVLTRARTRCHFIPLLTSAWLMAQDFEGFRPVEIEMRVKRRSRRARDSLSPPHKEGILLSRPGRHLSILLRRMIGKGKYMRRWESTGRFRLKVLFSLVKKYYGCSLQLKLVESKDIFFL